MRKLPPARENRLCIALVLFSPVVFKLTREYFDSGGASGETVSETA